MLRREVQGGWQADPLLLPLAAQHWLLEESRDQPGAAGAEALPHLPQGLKVLKLNWGINLVTS